MLLVRPLSRAGLKALAGGVKPAKARPFDREVRPFSEMAVIHQFQHRMF